MMFFQKIRSALRASKGAMLVEYGMIVGLIALGALGSSLVLGNQVKTTFCIAATEIQENLGMEVTGDCQDSGVSEVGAIEGGEPALTFSPNDLTEADGVFVLLNGERTVPYFVDFGSYLSLENIELSDVTWSMSGGPVAGLTLDPQTGVLSGTPTNATNYSFTISVQDENLSQTLPFSLIIEESYITNVVSPRRNVSYYTVYPATGSQVNVCRYYHGSSAYAESFTTRTITGVYHRRQSFNSSGWGGNTTWSTGNLSVLDTVTCRYPAP